MEVEERGLLATGRRDLARELRWVSDLDGDGAGYHIRSFDPETGAKKLIEVKTTCGGARVPFFMSRNERSFAEEWPEAFNLYRVFDFAAAPKIFKLRPPLEGAVNFEAEARRATFR
jgi:hypothetical protein